LKLLITYCYNHLDYHDSQFYETRKGAGSTHIIPKPTIVLNILYEQADHYLIYLIYGSNFRGNV